jgi:hypothetical protein
MGMKKVKNILLVFVFILSASTIKAQSYEAQQLLLNFEKLLQLKEILDDMYKGYEILSKGYTAIKDISEGNFDLHKDFLDGLLNVNPIIKQYKRIADIIQYQVLIVKNASNTLKNFEASDLFSSDEVDYMKTIYTNLINESANNIDDLMTVITANQLRMSDDERLAAIDRIFNDVQDKLMFLKSFNNSTSVLAAQRKYELWEVQKGKILYGIPK